MGTSIHWSVIEELNTKVDRMLWRMLQIEPLHMTHDEYLQLLAPPEHIEILNSVVGYADVSANEQYQDVSVPYVVDGVTGSKISLMMRTHAGKEPPLRPRVPSWHHQADMAIQKKVLQWMEHQYVQRRLAGTVCYVIGELAERCASGQTVRYLWPAIMHLFKGAQNERSIRWAEKFGVYRPVKSTPAILPGFRAVLHETSQWLTQAAMLEDIAETEFDEVVAHAGMLPSFIVNGSVVARRAY